MYLSPRCIADLSLSTQLYHCCHPWLNQSVFHPFCTQSLLYMLALITTTQSENMCHMQTHVNDAIINKVLQLVESYENIFEH